MIANMSMSLDGFVTDRDGSVEPVFDWYFKGTEPVDLPTTNLNFRMSAASAAVFSDGVANAGAIVCGRRLFDLTQGWGGLHPTGAPVFVVTHRPPDGDTKNATFVHTGVADAIEQARRVAGHRSVAVASADIARQCLDLDILDAIHVDLVPVIVGAGTPWFGGATATTRLSDPTITPGLGVTHLHYRVLRSTTPPTAPNDFPRKDTP